MKRYFIHPTIGFARVGTSDEVFVGPELPGTAAVPDNDSYRDSTAEKKLKRQGARFWIYEYDDEDPTVEVKRIGPDVQGIQSIQWSVHLMNKKAVWFEFQGVTGEGPNGYPPNHPLRNATITDPNDRKEQLIIDPRKRTIEANGTADSKEISKGTSDNAAAETWPPTLAGGKEIESLGTIGVDEQGRLTVAGGYGTSGTMGQLPANGLLQYDDNDEWFDDTSDGSVTATITLENGTTVEAVAAWVIVGPPDYAPKVENLVTVYDLLYDLGLRTLELDPNIYDPVTTQFNSNFEPSFTDDVYPILRRALDYRWVIEDAEEHALSPRFNIATLAATPDPNETPQTNPRRKIFRRMRDPDDLMASGAGNMPELQNDGVDGAPAQTMRFTVTRYQFFVLQQWSNGKFVPEDNWTGPPAPPTAVTPHGLDRAAMDAACGGSFFPGMEGSWILRDSRIYQTPFNFRITQLNSEGPTGLTPGDASKRMAIPWQADFLKCGNNWWPAQRPNQVVVGADRKEWDRGIQHHVQLTDDWSLLGIVADDPADPNRLIETERELPDP